MVHSHGLSLPSVHGGKHIGEFVALRGYPNEQKAMKMLRETASLVKPIMQKRGWMVPVLMEFWENPAWNTHAEIILGYNEGSGKVIALRLRMPTDRSSFYPLEEVVHTMLHELTHNVHHDHDEKFHGLMDQLVWEYSQLRQSGYNGEGFYYAEGQKLGRGRGFYNLGLVELRKQAITRHPPVTPAQPQSNPIPPPSQLPRLGGQLVQKGDRNRIAEAAEKRHREAKRCGLGHGGESEMNAIIKRGIISGIHEKPEPLSEAEMAAVMVQIQMLEEAESETQINNGGPIPPYLLIFDDKAEEAPGLPHNLLKGQQQNVSTESRASSLNDTRPLLGLSPDPTRRRTSQAMISGIHEKPEPLNEAEMAAVMVQIQMLEEAESETQINNRGPIPPYLLIFDDEAEEAPCPPHNPLTGQQQQQQNVSTEPRASSLNDTRPSPGLSSDPTRRRTSQADNSSQWAYRACTLFNPDTAMKCELCEASR